MEPRKATGIQLPANKTVRRRGRSVLVVWGTEPRVAQTLNAKGGAFREPQICETQVPTLKDRKSEAHDFFSVICLSPSKKAPFNFNLLLEGQYWVLLTNHLLIQQDMRLIPANTPCYKPSLSAEETQSTHDWKWICWHKYLLGYNYWTANPKMGGQSRFWQVFYLHLKL